MKVLKKGSKRGIWKKSVTCTGKGNAQDNAQKGIVACGAKLEIGARDIFRTESHSWPGETEYFYTIECPCCGALTDLNEKELPIEVKVFADKRSEKDVANDKDRFDDEESEM